MRISTAEHMNATRRNTMEDCFITQQPGSWEQPYAYIGVYDGHGGRDIVDFLQDSLHANVMEELNHGRGSSNEDEATRNTEAARHQESVRDSEVDNAGVHERLERAFLITDVQSQMKGIQTSGATVAMCLLERTMIKNEMNGQGGTMRVTIHAANVGDARAVLSRKPDSFTCTPMSSSLNEESSPLTSISTTRENPQSPVQSQNETCYRLTNDHKASSPTEISRIENAGGFLLRNRVLGIMAVARSLGDHGMKEFVIGRPFCQTVDVELKGYKMDQGDEFVILACDGLWDTLEDEEAIQMVRDFVFGARSNKDGDAMMADRDLLRDRAAKMLCGEALKRGTTDNVTVIVAWL